MARPFCLLLPCPMDTNCILTSLIGCFQINQLFFTWCIFYIQSKILILFIEIACIRCLAEPLLSMLPALCYLSMLPVDATCRCYLSMLPVYATCRFVDATCATCTLTSLVQTVAFRHRWPAGGRHCELAEEEDRPGRTGGRHGRGAEDDR